MKKSRAIFLLITHVVVIGGYVGWAAWNPAPNLQSMVFDKNVDAAARSAAEADFRAHPPTARKLTWKRFGNRLINPYQPRENSTIPVAIETFSDGAKELIIRYPAYPMGLERRRKDGTWHRPTEP